MSWSDAAALLVAAEAALGVLKQLRVVRDETLLVLGAAGSVGMIATQLAVSWGVTVIGVAAPRDEDLVRDLGAVPVTYGDGLADRVRRVVTLVDAVWTRPEGRKRGGWPMPSRSLEAQQA